MKITELLKNVAVKSIVNAREVEISGASTDSREEMPNSLFVCLKGGREDGHDHAFEAKEKGAVAVVCEREIKGLSLPQFLVEDSRVALAILSGNLYGNPAEKLRIVTVVGTNGKTSTVDILSEIFLRAGRLSATVGTLGFKIGKERESGALTTPDPLDLHRHLAEMVRRGVEYVFVEASAHAIYYSKLAGIKANLTIFTNLTQDHLDFFGTMESYAAVKLSYFCPECTAIAIVNSDDEYGRRLISARPVPVISYGLDNPADVFAINVEEGESGLSFTINAYDRIGEIHTALCGRFNVYNVMAATAAAMYLGVDLPVIERALREMCPVPGRFETRRIRGRRVVVDYAHTPDGLENLLSGLAREKRGKLIVVFGCGGNRDRTKRPIMGRIASTYADYSVITDDNPRDEREEEIAAEILSGIVKDTAREVVLDRREAILRAFELSAEGDTIVIAGKGHETTMEIRGEKKPYSDFAILQELDR